MLFLRPMYPHWQTNLNSSSAVNEFSKKLQMISLRARFTCKKEGFVPLNDESKIALSFIFLLGYSVTYPLLSIDLRDCRLERKRYRPTATYFWFDRSPNPSNKWSSLLYIHRVQNSKSEMFIFQVINSLDVEQRTSFCWKGLVIPVIKS